LRLPFNLFALAPRRAADHARQDRSDAASESVVRTALAARRVWFTEALRTAATTRGCEQHRR
jgi:hypothetical protein